MEDVPQNRTKKRWNIFPAHVAQLKRFFAPTSAGQFIDDGAEPLPLIDEEETEGIPPLSPVGAAEEEAAEGSPSEIVSLPVIPTQEEAPVIAGRAARVKTRPAWWEDYVVETKVNYR